MKGVYGDKEEQRTLRIIFRICHQTFKDQRTNALARCVHATHVDSVR